MGILFPLTILGALGFLSFIAFFKELRFKRMLVDTPYSKICSAAQGFVKIRGIVQPLDEKEVLISPLTQQPCCWYNYSIEKVKRQKNDKNELIEYKISDNLFRIIDDTGECIVYPHQALVVSHYKGTWNTHGFEPQLITAEPALMSRLKARLKDNYDYCFTEKRLNIGRETIILGYLQNYSTERNPIQENSTEQVNVEIQKLSFEEKPVAIEQWEKLKTSKENVNLISGFNLEGRPYIITDLNIYHYTKSARNNMCFFGGLFLLCSILITRLLFLYLTHSNY